MRLLLLALALNLLPNGLMAAACQGEAANVASRRFIFTQGEAYDTRTGLIWRRCSVGMTWTRGGGCTGERASMSFTEALKAAGNAGPGWRIPSIKELYSLVDTACGAPHVDVRTFPDLRFKDEDESAYWTSSALGLAGLIYYVDLRTGDADAHSPGFALAVRLVRSAR